MIYTCMKHFVYMCILQYICKIKNAETKLFGKSSESREKLIQYQENRRNMIVIKKNAKKYEKQ